MLKRFTALLVPSAESGRAPTFRAGDTSPVEEIAPAQQAATPEPERADLGIVELVASRPTEADFTANLDLGVQDSSLKFGAIASTSGLPRFYVDKATANTSRNGSGDTAVAVSPSGDLGIDGLLGGTRWADGSITYSDPDDSFDYGLYTIDDNSNGRSAQFEGFSQLTASQITAVHAALNEAVYTQFSGSSGLSAEAFTNLDIDYAGSGWGSGTIRAANSLDPSGAYAVRPSESIYGGDVWFGPTTGENPTTGNRDYFTILHELGHALGLKHGHQPALFGAIPVAVNSHEYSVMTYRSFVNGPDTDLNEFWGYSQTYMMYDIAALQYMYGADFGANSGDTTYTWDPFNGEMRIDGSLALDPGGNRIFATIWDGDGIDTYDLSNYTSDLDIDLAPGGHSTFSEVQLADLGGWPGGNFARGNVFNALQYDGDPRSLIENAVGGSGNDRILGNAADNALYGRIGDDLLSGLGGRDVLRGQSGDDTLRGDAGGDALNGGAGRDDVAGGAGSDRIHGNAGADVLSGDRGHDRIVGDRGADQMFGGAGNDRVHGGAGWDRIYGQRGRDVLSDGRADVMVGGSGADVFRLAVDGHTDRIRDYRDGLDSIRLGDFQVHRSDHHRHCPRTGVDRVSRRRARSGAWRPERLPSGSGRLYLRLMRTVSLAMRRAAGRHLSPRGQIEARRAPDRARTPLRSTGNRTKQRPVSECSAAW